MTDIAQNGAEAGADLLELEVSETADSGGRRELRFTVKDNGKGMTAEELKAAQDPFVTDGVKHPHRKVGLGLPFLIQTAEISGGGWEMESAKRVSPHTPCGTTVSAWFDLGNVDTPPMGDIPG
ncbi:MAG: ATP-binding protein, partial [Treponema sp.]|nr:ATP-binding protein [Treponema sp.]